MWAALFCAPHASAATTFTVTRTDDPPPDACQPGDCSLREAVIAANAGSGGDTIALPAGDYRLGIAGIGEAAAAKGDLDLNRSVTITGAGARSSVVDAAGLDRVFEIASGAVVLISDVTVTGGAGPGGAGIANAGTLTLVRDTIVGNAVAGSDSGGGIESDGTLTISRSTISGNRAHVGGGIAFTGSLNLSDTADCALMGTGDHQGVPVLLGPLADNGGSTDTQALLPGSPARDAGANCPATDERGVSRPRGAACDIGAYEVAPPLATTGAASAVTFGAARLNGTVDPSARETTAVFEYGTTTAYSSTIQLGIAGSGVGSVPVSAFLTGLRQGVTYHYRLVATNAEGAAAGADLTFTTLDKVKPVLSLLRVLPGLFHRAKGGKINFRLSEPATVTFRVDRVLRGVRRHGSCVVRNRRARGKACTRYVPVPGSFAQPGGTGPNTFHFDARVGGRLLFPGAYRLRASPRDHAGNLGKTVVAAFRVLR